MENETEAKNDAVFLSESKSTAGQYLKEQELYDILLRVEEYVNELFKIHDPNTPSIE